MRLIHLAQFHRLALLSAPILLGATSIAAQTGTTVDYPRISVGISGGVRAGAFLWDIPDQTILATGANPLDHPPSSVFHLHRDVAVGQTFTAFANFYSGPRWGFTFEFAYLGLTLDDTCELAVDGGDAVLKAACAGLHGGARYADGFQGHGGSAISFNVGAAYRTSVGKGMQPYFKGLVGLATLPTSTVAMSSTYGDIGSPVNLTIYPAFGSNAVRLSGTAVAGISSAPVHGFGIHLEVRETFITQEVVTAATASQNLVPPSTAVWKGFPSILFGFDLVLKREHGKRY